MKIMETCENQRRYFSLTILFLDLNIKRLIITEYANQIKGHS